MGNNFSSTEIIIIVVVGLILVWLFYTLLFSIKLPKFKWGAKEEDDMELPFVREGTAGDPKTCPVCAAKLYEGQLVNSAAFPAAKGSRDRLMHIRGCTYCISGQRERSCPVCQASLRVEEHLISSLFERSMGASAKRSHVHVVGCSKCRGPQPKPG